MGRQPLPILKIRCIISLSSFQTIPVRNLNKREVKLLPLVTELVISGIRT